MTKILVITDFDFRHSGYKNIAEKLLDEMALMGYEIKILGLSYKGEEHLHNYSIIPTNGIYDAAQMALNMEYFWTPDIFLVMLDIPLQIFFLSQLPHFQQRYIGITPLENGPLTMSWAAGLISMPAILFISELGKNEAIKSGLRSADHIQIGIDAENEWRMPTQDEKHKIREGLGFSDDTFIVLTVADNQERKNLWGGMRAIEILKKELLLEKPIRYILVTREESEVGWRLQDLAVSMGLSRELVIYKKGMPQKDLWSLYACADAFLLPSKAEGLGMPILESFATGVPVVGTDTGAIHELLDDGRGFLIEPEYTFTDVWGNSTRDMISSYDAALILKTLAEYGADSVRENANSYVKTRTWKQSAQKLHETIEKVKNGKE